MNNKHRKPPYSSIIWTYKNKLDITDFWFRDFNLLQPIIELAVQSYEKKKEEDEDQRGILGASFMRISSCLFVQH